MTESASVKAELKWSAVHRVEDGTVSGLARAHAQLDAVNPRRARIEVL